MVKSVKTKTVRSLAKGQRAVLLPGPTMAEPWELWVLGANAPEMVQVCQTPLENRLRKETTLALPVAQVYCLPLWVHETEAKQITSLIPLQLETRGLQRGTDTAVFDYTVVAQEDGRTLISIGVLPSTLPAELHAEAYGSFDLSARFHDFPPDAMTLWSEHDRLVVAITRGPSLVYFQALNEGDLTTRIVQDLACLNATLMMQDIITHLSRIVIRADVSTEEAAALQKAIPVQIEQDESPQPTAPKPAWKLTPAVVDEARRNRENQRWMKRGLIIFLAVYLIAVAWIITNYVMASLRVADLRKWQASHESAVTEVQNSAAAWKELGPVVDQDAYPIEVLYHINDSIPTDQLHLTLFETGVNKVLIKGEAKNVAAAFSFKTKMQGDPFFTGYNFAMGNPRPLPNDLAQFQIDGSRTGGSAVPQP